MVFFFSLRESTARPGTIEPDILPFSSGASQTSTTRLVGAKPSTTSTFREYITTWDTSDTPALLRRIVCVLAFLLHLPLNIISILSHGLSLGLILGIVFSVLNLLCLGLALWKLDVMRGQRLFYNWIYKRHNFDYVILGATLTYACAFGVLLGARLGLRHWAWYLRVVWPFTVCADIVCFLAAWISTWRDVTTG